MNRWTEQDDKFLTENLDILTLEQIGLHLNRTKSSVENRKTTLKLKKKRKLHPKVGDVINLCEILDVYYEIRGKRRVKIAVVRCTCPKQAIRAVQMSGIVNGSIKSCGCYRDENSKEALRLSTVTHGESKTRLYATWSKMKSRATNLDSKHAKNYVGRGISICEEWLKYEPFRDWALANGYRDDLTIDRINNNGDYTPENCRWVTNKVQMNNVRYNFLITAFGETKTAKQWSEDPRITVKYETFKSRIKNGWEPELALTTKAKWTKRK